jgi:hypothetical protein
MVSTPGSYDHQMAQPCIPSPTVTKYTLAGMATANC